MASSCSRLESEIFRKCCDSSQMHCLFIPRFLMHPLRTSFIVLSSNNLQHGNVRGLPNIRCRSDCGSKMSVSPNCEPGLWKNIRWKPALAPGNSIADACLSIAPLSCAHQSLLVHVIADHMLRVHICVKWICPLVRTSVLGLLGLREFSYKLCSLCQEFIVLPEV